MTMLEAAPDVVICVPARNEEERLPALLRSLDRQSGFCADRRLRVVVVANNCTDGTVPLLEALDVSGAWPAIRLRVLDIALDTARANVGHARGIALDEGVAWLERDGRDDGVLISTDADAEAPPDWIASNLVALRGADVVGGRLVGDDPAARALAVARLDDAIERYWVGVRRLEDLIDPPPHDPPPRHGDHTGASLALSASLYRRAGGLPRLACGEDNALVENVRRLGARVRHCPHVSIVVSSRPGGRVEGGMASEMSRRADLATRGDPYLLPVASHWRDLLRRRAALRAAWRDWSKDRGDMTSFAALGLGSADIAAIDPHDCANDIAFVERVMARCDSGETPLLQPVDEANAALERLAATWDGRAYPAAAP